MTGVRVLEVAQWTFVPAAGAVLADWGADVIKIEHPVTGDSQRGLRQLGSVKIEGNRNPVMEHANRGKRSVALDISTPEGHELVMDIARTSDVFLTNFPASYPPEAEDRRRRGSRRQRRHRVRAGECLWPARCRRGDRRLRPHRVLESLGERIRFDAKRFRRSNLPTGARVW